eukprot:TRINITY_DN48741_c0_g1_i1.p2 TRINITY_DN48741_c0_g1~~TRINITY_DN48741_c0_g1_i1.p2  ORF type:complete len:108 (+),score=7.90 TRINITY_DN48741_c0_g1_i1:14-337(+)
MVIFYHFIEKRYNFNNFVWHKDKKVRSFCDLTFKSRLRGKYPRTERTLLTILKDLHLRRDTHIKMLQPGLSRSKSRDLSGTPIISFKQAKRIEIHKTGLDILQRWGT